VSVGAVPAAEPIVRLEPSPGRIEVRLPDLDALYDRNARPVYPHTSPVIEESVAEFLLREARGQRGRHDIAVVLSVGGPPLGAEQEAAVRTHLNRFFANEAELASLDLRVNRTEGMGSLRYAAPLVAVALLVMGLLYSQVGALSGTGYLIALTYLVFATIVWVMLWDPVEVLLFDSYFIRSRIRALRVLASAAVEFT
jgi:hypothetical protein